MRLRRRLAAVQREGQLASAGGERSGEREGGAAEERHRAQRGRLVGVARVPEGLLHVPQLQLERRPDAAAQRREIEADDGAKGGRGRPLAPLRPPEQVPRRSA